MTTSYTKDYGNLTYNNDHFVECMKTALLLYKGISEEQKKQLRACTYTISELRDMIVVALNEQFDENQQLKKAAEATAKLVEAALQSDLFK